MNRCNLNVSVFALHGYRNYTNRSRHFRKLHHPQSLVTSKYCHLHSGPQARKQSLVNFTVCNVKHRNYSPLVFSNDRQREFLNYNPTLALHSVSYCHMCSVVGEHKCRTLGSHANLYCNYDIYSPVSSSYDTPRRMVVFYRKTCEASRYDSFQFFHMHHGHDDEVANLDDYRGPILTEPDSLSPEPHD